MKLSICRRMPGGGISCGSASGSSCTTPPSTRPSREATARDRVCSRPPTISSMAWVAGAGRSVAAAVSSAAGCTRRCWKALLPSRSDGKSSSRLSRDSMPPVPVPPAPCQIVGGIRDLQLRNTLLVPHSAPIPLTAFALASAL